MSQRWVVSVTLAGKCNEPEPYPGPNDVGAVTVVSTYGTSYTGIGTSAEEAIAVARREREAALSHVEGVLDHLQDTAADAEPVPKVGLDLIGEVRCLLGTQRVQPALQEVSGDMLVEWIAELRRAVGGEKLEELEG